MRISTLVEQLAHLQELGIVTVGSLHWRLDMLAKYAIAVFISPHDSGSIRELVLYLRNFDAQETRQLNLRRSWRLSLFLRPQATALEIIEAASHLRVSRYNRRRMRRR